MDKKSSFRLCFVTSPIPEIQGGHILVENILQIIEPLAEDILVITSNYPQSAVLSPKIHFREIKRENKRKSTMGGILRYIKVQLTFASNLIKLSKDVDIIIFFIGGTTFLLPMLAAKLLTKKTVLFTPGSASKCAAKTYNKKIFGMGGVIFSSILRMLEHVNLYLTDQIVVESEGTIDFLGLNRYRKKISANCALYINFNLFKVKKDFKDRKNLIGYIGRLSPEKGVLNFAKAIPLILKERSDLEFLIGGDGSLFDEIKKELKNNGSYDKVELTGWVPHDELPNYLNELKLIVAPSYTEGGIPATIQEAMACGTIVLVTPVAGVDVIKEDKNGFILEDNSPECIAKKVIQVLKYPQPDKIIDNAYNLAKEEFSFENTVKRYREVLYGKQERE